MFKSSRLYPAKKIGWWVLLFLMLPAEAAGPYRFYTVTPCRVLDTRSAFRSGAFAPNESRAIYVTERFIIGQGGAEDCGIPFPEAKGVFINVIAVEPTGTANNHLTIYPAESTEPTASTLNYQPGVFAIANGVLVSVCGSAVCKSDLTITNGPSASTHVVIDVTGYLAE